MKKNLIALALLAVAGASHAGAYIVDDFNTGAQNISQDVVAGTPVESTVTERVLSIIKTAGDDGDVAKARVNTTAGKLSVSNDSGVNSTVGVSWNLAAGVVPLNVLDVSFLFKIILSDGNPTDIAFTLNGTNIYSSAIPGNTSNTDKTFTLDPALISAGGVLALTLNGAPGWDLELDAFGISWTDPVTPPNPPAPIPEPASMALMGLGALGLAAVRRRK